LRRYGFRILKEQWRGGSSAVFLTLARGEFIYEALKYETYDWYGIGYCECLEISRVLSPSKVGQSQQFPFLPARTGL
jgi:hypothetical protein